MYTINKKEVSVLVSIKINEVGNRIKELRKSRNMTQQDLAYYCFSDKCLISEIERGRTKNITMYTFFKIAKVLNVTADYLFTG